MHPFLWAGIILHATGLAVLAFFVLFAASKAEGIVKSIGNILGGWLVILVIIGIIGAATFGGRPFGAVMGGHMGPGWPGSWRCPAAPSAPPQTAP